MPRPIAPAPTTCHAKDQDGRQEAEDQRKPIDGVEHRHGHVQRPPKKTADLLEHDMEAKPGHQVQDVRMAPKLFSQLKLDYPQTAPLKALALRIAGQGVPQAAGQVRAPIQSLEAPEQYPVSRRNE